MGSIAFFIFFVCVCVIGIRIVMIVLFFFFNDEIGNYMATFNFFDVPFWVFKYHEGLNRRNSQFYHEGT